MASERDPVIDEIAHRVGTPPRLFSLLRWKHGRSPPPNWLKADDLISRIYANQGQILKNGVVRWGCIVQANKTAFQPGVGTSGAQVVYAVNDDISLDELQDIAARTYVLKGTTPSAPDELRLATMLTDAMERALDWEIPKSLTQGKNVTTTIVMVPRAHMIGGFLGLRRLPLLVDPQTALALLVPCSYWPASLVAEWKGETDAVVRRLDSAPVIELTRAAADAIEPLLAKQGTGETSLRVGLKRDGKGNFLYVLGFVDGVPNAQKDQVSFSRGVRILVDRDHRVHLLGTTIDYRSGDSGTGFIFNNPNV